MKEKLSALELTLNMHLGTKGFNISEIVNYISELNDNDPQYMKEDFQGLLMFLNEHI